LSASRSACDPVLGGAPDAEADAEDMRTRRRAGNGVERRRSKRPVG
jgi:hypothetical protein